MVSKLTKKYLTVMITAIWFSIITLFAILFTNTL